MHTTDPQRPQVNGLPAYGTGPYYPLPQLAVLVLNEQEVVLSCFLANDYNSFSYKHAKLPLEQLPQAFLAYYNDPEDFFLQAYQYTPPAKSQAKSQAKVSFSLKDLGLAR
jgi:hypothetical protein